MTSWRKGHKGSEVVCEVTEMRKKKKEKKRKGYKDGKREMLLAEAFQMAVSKANLYL